MPRFRSETFAANDRTWLGSTHGLANARTETLDVTVGFTAATHYPDGFLKSGLPLGKVTATGKVGLYDSAAVDGRNKLIGFLATEQVVTGTPGASATGTFPVPVLDHGRVKVAKLPIAFTAPAAASDLTQIVYI